MLTTVQVKKKTNPFVFAENFANNAMLDDSGFVPPSSASDYIMPFIKEYF